MAYRIAILPLAEETWRAHTPDVIIATVRNIPDVAEASLDPIGQNVRIVFDGASVGILDIADQLTGRGFTTSTPITSEGRL